mgnify:CR=1 FL=1
MHLGFLARFAAVLLIGATAVAAGLSYVLASSHLQAVRRDLVAATIGQASAQLQPALNAYVRERAMKQDTLASISTAVRDIENFQELVRDVRIYAPSGQALDPSSSLPQPGPVRRAIAKQDVIDSPVFQRDGDSLITAYVPLGASGASGYVAVAAIDISLGQLDVQTQSETRFVVLATVTAVALLFISLLTLAIAAQRELNRRQRIADSTFLQTMEGIASIVDQRDPYTAGHSKRVSDYAVKVAESLGENAAAVERVRAGALLHDLGKIGIPDAVLLKPGPLDADERRAINSHPSMAIEILGKVEAMEPIVPCVLHHHERWDGTGYPDGLAGEQIPHLARIIAVADTFDAMTTSRPYRAALPVEEARRRLLAGRSVQWDARCVDALVALVDSRAISPPASDQQSEVFGRRLAVKDLS